MTAPPASGGRNDYGNWFAGSGIGQLTIRSLLTAMLIIGLHVSSCRVCCSRPKGPPKITLDYQQKYLVRETETLKINCPVESNPASLVNWKKDDQTIHLGWERFRLAGNVMRIKNVEWEDTGVYVCKATNGFGSIEATFFIYVYGNGSKTPPNSIFDKFFANAQSRTTASLRWMSSNMENKTVECGESIDLECHTRDQIQQKMDWFKMIGSDDAVESHQMKSVVTIDSQRFLFLHHGSTIYSGSGSIVSRLSLPDATEQDAGVYVCVQPGSSNPIRNSFHVIVLPPISPTNEVQRLSRPIWILIIASASLLSLGLTLTLALVLHRRSHRTRKQGVAVSRLPTVASLFGDQSTYPDFRSLHQPILSLPRHDGKYIRCCPQAADTCSNENYCTSDSQSDHTVTSMSAIRRAPLVQHFNQRQPLIS